MEEPICREKDPYTLCLGGALSAVTLIVPIALQQENQQPQMK